MHDTLTGLGNRRFLEENLEPLFQSAWSQGADLVCIAIDMDHFKQVNDTLGHEAGDKLLVFMGELIRGSIRREDFGVRLGGDEFLVLMPDSDLEGGRAYGERVVSLFRQHVRATLPQGVRANLSVGVAAVSGGATSGRRLVKAADSNLYAAKRAGRGQVICA